MNYEEAVSYINELQMFARKHTLDHNKGSFLFVFRHAAGEEKDDPCGRDKWERERLQISEALLIGEGKRTDCLHPLI